MASGYAGLDKSVLYAEDDDGVRDAKKVVEDGKGGGLNVQPPA